MDRKSASGLLFLVFLFSAIVYISWVLLLGGPRLGEKVPGASYKNVLTFSLPLAENVYNGGTGSQSLYDGMLLSAGDFFGFEPRNPYTYMNVLSGMNRAFYEKIYKGYLAANEQDFIQNKKLDYTKDNFYKPSEQTPVKPDPNGNIGPVDLQFTNDTSYAIDAAALKLEPLHLKSGGGGPRVLVYHTHTTESYISALSDLDSGKVPSWNEDPAFNITRVGAALSNNLENTYGIDTIFSRTVHDYPDYGSAYNNSLKTAENILKSYPSIGVALDIHRDGLDENGEKLRLITDVSGKTAARIMFVVGTDEGGLAHPNWRENLKLAIRMQEILNRDHPGLARPIFVSQYRFNQHLSNGSLIVEIGGDGNLYDEAIESTKYIAAALAEILQTAD